MFSMAHNTYAYAAQPAPQSRQYSGHGTSSAFSSSANPDEDWTKISDLAERRRIQNRIAQRNYRKKLKRRLEDLERRAGKSDGTSSGSEKPTPAAKTGGSSKKASSAKSQKQTSSIAPSKPVQQSFTPPMAEEEYFLQHSPYDDRERSHTPPMFAYSTYPPPPEELMIPPYNSQPASYRPMTTEMHHEYMTPAPVPVTLPSMTHFHDAVKREPGYPEETVYMYQSNYLPGIDMGNASAPSPYDPHTPPLSHSFDLSASCSDSGSYDAYPTTPLSMPGSPYLVAQQI